MHSQNYKLTPAPSENCFAIFLLRVRSKKNFLFLYLKKISLFLVLSFGHRVHFRGQKLTFLQKKIKILNHPVLLASKLPTVPRSRKKISARLLISNHEKRVSFIEKKKFKKNDKFCQFFEKNLINFDKFR
jgi:hypothetical protein